MEGEAERTGSTEEAWRLVDDALAKEDYDTARFRLIQLVSQGDVRALSLLGLIYEYGGKTFKRSQAVAVRHYRKAIFEEDDGLAHFGIARALHNGDGVERDLEKASLHMRKAADRGHPEASLYAGLELLHGNVNQEPLLLQEAMRYLEVASSHGYLAATAVVGRWDIRQGRYLRGLFRLVLGGVTTFFLSLKNRKHPRLLLIHPSQT
jgi:TPR repeat protein